ncbi:MAG: DUF4292 domain-containing protein [Bacteroidales bacterium]|nr:DUF4292 domain-containing protein [Bacteroidales bacterium]
MKKIIILLAVLFSFYGTACKAAAQQDTLPTKIPYSWISYQAKVDLSFGGSSYQAQLFFVNRIDSLIYLNLSLFGAEVGRMVLTPDSVIFVNKLENNYYKGDYTLLRNLLMVDFDFYMAQSLFNGVDFPHFEGEATIEMENGLTKFFFPDRVMQNSARGTHFAQEIVTNGSNAIVVDNIEDLTTGNLIIVKYDDYSVTDSTYFFNKLTLQQKDKEILLSASLKKLRINTPGPTSISIPDKFKPLKMN